MEAVVVEVERSKRCVAGGSHAACQQLVGNSPPIAFVECPVPIAQMLYFLAKHLNYFILYQLVRFHFV